MYFSHMAVSGIHLRYLINRNKSQSFPPYKHVTNQQALSGCRKADNCTFPCAGSFFVIPLCTLHTVPLGHVKFNFHLISVRSWSKNAHKKNVVLPAASRTYGHGISHPGLHGSLLSRRRGMTYTLKKDTPLILVWQEKWEIEPYLNT